MHEETPRRRWWWCAVAVAAAVSSTVAWPVLGLGGPFAAQVHSDLASTFIPLAGAVACARAARRRPGAGRAWGLLAAALASWGAGQAVWSYYELVLRHDVPFPSAADVGYLGFVPLAAVALVSFLSTPAGAVARLRLVVEALLVAAGLLFVSWAVLLGDLYRDSEATALERAVGLAYPVGDVVLVSIVLLVASRHRRGAETGALGLVGAGLVAIAAADSSFAYLTQAGSYATGGLCDAGWMAGFAMVGLAAMRPPRPAAGAGRARSDWAGALAPYAPVAAALATAAAGLGAGGARSFDAFLAWDAVAIGVFLVAHQLPALRENHVLARHLEDEVATRTTELEALAAELREREEHYRTASASLEALVEASPAALVELDRPGRVRRWNPAAEAMFGWSAAEAIGLEFPLIPDDGREEFEALLRRLRAGGTVAGVEVVCRRRDGSLVDVSLSSALVKDAAGRTTGILGVLTDVTERKRLEAELAHQAFHDPLTGLANRALLADRLRHALERAARTEASVTVLLVDLDGFKAVNDSLGHAAGDELLAAVAERLRSCVRPADTVARLGGDEFALLFEEATDADEARAVAERVLAEVRRPVVLQGREVAVGASIGIATGTSGASTDLLRDADLAMYLAKAKGKGRCEAYEPTMHASVLERLDLLSDLRHAVERNELVVHYQPVVALDSSRITGVEALVRWRHPRRGLVPPAEFIPLAEESGAILAIGQWVLEEACRQAAAWRKPGKGAEALTVSVNLSAVQLRDPALAARVAAALDHTGLAPEALVLEITESVLVEDPDAVARCLARLKDLGVLLAVDDFGTGYSSLSYLRRFPVDVLKIDRSFVEDIGHGDEQAALTQGIVELARRCGLRTVAEGVETPGQVDGLRAMRCHSAQGYHFARPVAAGELAELLALGVRDATAPAPALA